MKPSRTRKPGRRRAAGPRGVAEASVSYGLLGVPERVARVVEVLGNNLVADVLGVSKSQPSRWRSGHERISGENMVKLIDLDTVVTRLLMLMTPRVIRLWLDGSEPHLGGERPIDVLHLRGPAPLLVAIDGIAAGAYA